MIYFELILLEEKTLSGLDLSIYFIMLFVRNILWECLWVLPQMIPITLKIFKKTLEIGEN